MTLLNTFFFKYVSNAKDVIKDNKDIEKSFKGVEHSADEAGEATKNFGQGFAKAIDGLTNATAVWAGFNILKSGVMDAANLNTQLGRMAQLTDQNTQALKAFGSAAEAAGGSSQGALSDYFAQASQIQAAGGTPLSPQDTLRAVRSRIKGLSNSQKQAFLTRNGFTDIGDRYLASIASDEDFERRIANSDKLNPRSSADTTAAFNQTEAAAALNAAKQTGYTGLGTAALPAAGSIENAASQHPYGAVAASVLAAVGGIKGLGWIAKLGGRALGLGGTSEAVAGVGEAAAASGGIGALGVAGAGLAGLGLGYGGVSYFHNGIENLMTKFMTRDLVQNPLSESQKRGSSALSYLMSKGYSREQAAGVLANISAESGGNPNARGDGGSAVGLFQWHPDRVKAILGATGIDVRSASAQDQLKAAVWEMKSGRHQFDDDHFRSIKSPAEAAAYFSRKFEAPANGMFQSLMRGKSALALSKQFSNAFGGSSGGVKIDKIEIITQATDAKGIAGSLKEELYSALGFLAADHDDGQAK